MDILLVEPDFPISLKSKNHKNFLPIGLLKIASYLRNKGDKVSLSRGIPKNLLEIAKIRDFDPDEIWITSLFTYWAKYVRDAVQYYKEMFPGAKIVVGGIFASLLPRAEVKKYTGCHKVHQGVIPEVERLLPAYDLIEDANPQSVDYQIIHTSRGCKRKCPFCGTWKIEPKFIPKKNIKGKLKHGKVVFYDNNLLMNPYIENIVQELIELKERKQIIWCESQSGFDGRVLLEKPRLAKLLKKAGFRSPRIAWDWGYKEYSKIKKQIDILTHAGYPSDEIYVFVLYNWDIPFEEMEMKRIKCLEWKVQIADCRYRPLNQLYDNYNPRKKRQTSKDYYIHEKWTDALVKQFRKNVREQNICVRHGFPFYSNSFENKKVGKEIMRKIKNLKNINDKKRFLETISADYWFPNQIRYPAHTKTDNSNEVKPTTC